VEDETHSLEILTQVRIEPLHFVFEDAYPYNVTCLQPNASRRRFRRCER
jgi:hypothetical protein